MDRRQEKTKKAIYEAFYKLIQKEDYSKISVQDIIDEANVGRSTYYGHFETKDDLLISMCKELFEHIFNPDKNEEAHCFINSSTTKDKIVHILCHLLEKKDVIKGIFKSESAEIFIKHFRMYLNKVSLSLDKKIEGLPYSFLQNHISGSFIEMIKYWVLNNFKESPELLTNYFLMVLPKEITSGEI